MTFCKRCKTKEAEERCVWCTACRKSGSKEDITQLWERERNEQKTPLH